MPNLTKQQMRELAHIVGIDLDDQRAELAAARLGAVLDALEEISEDALARVEPATTFAPQEFADD